MRVKYPNITLAVCDWIRYQLPTYAAGQRWADPLVTNKWDDSELKKVEFIVVVRDDDGPRMPPISKMSSVGITCFGPRDSGESGDLACQQLGQDVMDALADCARVGSINSFTDCDNLYGPSPIGSETGRPAYYITADLTVVGEII